MQYFNWFILIAFTILCFIIMRTVSHSNRTETRFKQEFLSRESEANAVRKADISTLPHIEIPLAKLPLSALSACGKEDLAAELTNLQGEKILDLSRYTNTDLKMMYGPANLDTLSEYDENFTSLIRLLDAIGSALIDADNSDAAESFLAYAVEIGSDVTHTYELLGTLYQTNGDTKKLQQLIQRAKTITSLSGKTIVNKLHSIKSQAK